MQSTLKPEKVFKAIVNTKPMIIGIHELNTPLHNPYAIFEHDRIYHVKDIGVDIVLSIKNGDNLVRGAPQTYIETVRLVNRRIRKGLNTYKRGTNVTNSAPCFGNRSCITCVTNHNNF